MNYHIDTILLWDSFKADCECPFCLIQEKCDKDFVDSALGGSVMEPDRRIEVNKYGFCSDHLSKLYAMQNRLGLALMAHSHIREIIQEHAALTEQLIAGLDERRRLRLRGLPAANGFRQTGHPLPDLVGAVERRCSTCFICNRLDDTMDRYMRNTVTLWAEDEEFQATFSKGKGFCMPHYAQMLKTAEAVLHGKSRGHFLRSATQIQTEGLKRIEQELEWYTLKFDYRNQDKPWGNSKDAVERTLRKLRGWSKDSGKT